ncbi:expressed unknown protein [Seminavis robusta]|uniref:BTB domain-containing protein n=1 Tax=Seminavis robusta TaxID=568900 RepID=A0A9N8HHF0_9STRA|nr:expressed unknown protein [Seminavis robusta]|eukprot:Sro701_g189850.1 n/a (434) ;mRNA; f:41542-42843
MEKSTGSTISKAPFEEALRNIWRDDKLQDITLKGNDGVLVPANRAVLAVRSKVFHRLFFGEFREASLDCVEVAFPGDVVKTVVEYVHTNSAEILRKWKFFSFEDDAPYNSLEIRVLVSLADAAAYYDLPGLAEAVLDAMTFISKLWPCLSLLALEACVKTGPSVPELTDKVLTGVRSYSNGDLEAKHLASLSSDVMVLLLKDTEMQVTEYQLFQLLSLWTEAGYLSVDEKASRCQEASHLSKHIDLGKIAFQHLSTTVTDSGLVTKDQLFEAYKTQAQAAQDGSGLPDFEDPRFQQWASSLPANEELPREIKVEGAQSGEINGVYGRSGRMNGAPSFTLNSKHNGKDCTITMFRQHYLDGDFCWFLSILQPGSSNDVRHYRSSYQKIGTDIPPADTWICCSKTVGTDPPKVLYKKRCPRNQFLSFTSFEQAAS